MGNIRYIQATGRHLCLVGEREARFARDLLEIGLAPKFFHSCASAANLTVQYAMVFVRYCRMISGITRRTHGNTDVFQKISCPFDV